MLSADAPDDQIVLGPSVRENDVGAPVAVELSESHRARHIDRSTGLERAVAVTDQKRRIRGTATTFQKDVEPAVVVRIRDEDPAPPRCRGDDGGTERSRPCIRKNDEIARQKIRARIPRHVGKRDGGDRATVRNVERRLRDERSVAQAAV